MSTAKFGYHTKDGTRVPGVTTVIGKFKEAEGLIHWAWNLGMQGQDYRQVRDDAAHAGTLAHSLVEQWVRKQEPRVQGPAAVVEKAHTAFRGFLAWAKQTDLKITATEVGLVSEQHRYGGTLDAMLVDGKRSLGDWKTSAKIYGDHLFQLAAYAILWDETHPEEKIDGGYHLLRFDKENGHFSHHYWRELDEAKHGFLLMRNLYDVKAKVDKLVK